jgi:hypothetical protein
MLLLPEEQLPACSEGDPRRSRGHQPGNAEIDDVITAILVSRFSGRTVPEICAMGGITVDDFTSSVAYREIFGLGPPGRPPGGPPAEAAASHPALASTPLRHPHPQPTGPHPGPPLSALEALADALLDFQGPEDLNAWLSRHAS